MSEADKMFEELGYVIDSTYYQFEHHIVYCKNSTRIDFDISRVTVYKYDIGGYNSSMSMQELKAINKKCEELGWIEEVIKV